MMFKATTTAVITTTLLVHSKYSKATELAVISEMEEMLMLMGLPTTVATEEPTLVVMAESDTLEESITVFMEVAVMEGVVRLAEIMLA